MKQEKPRPDAAPDPFTELLRKVVQTPKAEIDRREAEYQKEQAKKPRRGPKPGRKRG